jgi:hypothetical protein
MIKTIAFILIYTICGRAFAGTRVAFLEVYDKKGQLIQYEPGGRFGHSAIEVGGQWLQSYPGEGVQLISFEELQHRGKVTAIVEVDREVKIDDVQGYLNRPFDFWYSWSDDALYCSELVAKILKIPPQQMRLNHQVWPKHYWPLEGQPGISPDKLYQILVDHRSKL